jgi:hypothetical protein
VLSKGVAAHAMHFARQGDFENAWQAIRTPSQAAIERNERLIAIYKARAQLREEQREKARECQDTACKALIEQRARDFIELKDRQKQDRGELQGIQMARQHDEPYSHNRLIELLRPFPDAPVRYQPMLGPAVLEHAPKPAEKLEPTVSKAIQSEIETQHGEDARHDPTEKAPRRDTFDGLASGIGKLAEVAADILGSLITPENEQGRAAREARARAQAEAVPQRDAAAEEKERLEHQAAYERQMGAEERMAAYFEKHADRILREMLERRARERGTKER